MSEYVTSARRSITEEVNGAQVKIIKDNFFTAHWNDILGSLPDPLLIIGNPPWVTDCGTRKPWQRKSSFQVKFPETIGNRCHNRKEQF